MNHDEYTSDYFAAVSADAKTSSIEIVPIVVRLLRPDSVVDVGCGAGTWLRTFEENGVAECLGIDKYIASDKLQICPDRFHRSDLTRALNVNRRFDLAVSLEVAEHLPEECAEVFVKSLTALSDIVLFSAAVPGQGGKHHVNEQWPRYWASLFSRLDFSPVDFLRLQVWENPKVAYWYAQNTILYIKSDRLCDYPSLQQYDLRQPPISLVHPSKFLELQDWCATHSR